ncbi:squalene--hopene cyclase [Virgibacillus ndiopensis]|uniref:squalene--hopene cyclase n=1 Tax=Virgibacillus ndiopensis TaxID=2004408 RepID=UPI000C06ED84|nr:squalene--hopene cyclase [Virgibacillus ndiopensis]
MKNDVKTEINRLIKIMKDKQSNDGTWRFCFEGSSMTDAYMIILLRSLEINDEELIKELARRIQSKQSENGSWKLYKDEKEGNLSATIEAYYALLFSGYQQKDAKQMEKAKQYIIRKGCLDKANSLTKVMLAVTGQIPWPKYFPVPIEMILLPQSFPINFFDFVGYARVHMVPILIVADQKFVLKRKGSPNLPDLLNSRISENDSFKELRSPEARSLIDSIKQCVNSLIGFPSKLHQMALKEAKKYMLARLESDGTLYSYFSATFLMIFSLLALGHSKDDQVIKQAVSGLKSLKCQSNGHIQNSTSTVWDTSLISYALQASGVDNASQTIQKAIQYILQRQHYQFGDWVIHNPYVLPGGWGFSDINKWNPDVDDTTAALRAVRKTVRASPHLRQSWFRGINWVLSMQNDDGGWPAFEKNTDKKILTLVPIDGAESASIDPSSSDLTGRTLEFLGQDASLTIHHPQIKRGVEWLERNQEKDGSWYGRWGISYIYGTWAALTGMRAVGVKKEQDAIKKGINWLKNVQNIDGGWGESCASDRERRYISLGSSTPSQTAWAVDALISVFDYRTEEIDRGIDCLIKLLNERDWTYTYPTGAGLPGSFYIYYHSYNYIWPLLTLSHYVEKYD